MTYFAVRDAVENDYCITIADASYTASFRKHAAWWIRYMHHPSIETRKKYKDSPKGMPCFPVRVIVEDDDMGRGELNDGDSSAKRPSHPNRFSLSANT